MRKFRSVIMLSALIAGTGLMLRAQLQQEAGSWASIGASPDHRVGAAAVALGDGRTLIAGGVIDGTPTDVVIIYDPADASVGNAGRLLLPRAGHTATLLEDGRVLIAGGTVNNVL